MVSNSKKIDAAKGALEGCLKDAELSVNRLRSEIHSTQYADAIETPEFKHKLESETLTVALSLHRLEDAMKRFLKRSGGDTKAFDKQLCSSIPIKVTGQLANSWKHGLGGQKKNATVLNGVISVKRGDGFPDESGKERVKLVGMLVADSVHGPIPSSTLFEHAVRHWAALLRPVIADADEWAARVFPKPKRPVINFSHATVAQVPVESTVFFELPDDIQSQHKADAKKRGESA